MDIPKEYAFIGVAAASIGVFWGQFKAMITRIRSLVIVTHHVKANGHHAFMRYCWDTYRAGTFVGKTFDGWQYFIRPLEKYGYVPVETSGPGTTITFWDG